MSLPVYVLVAADFLLIAALPRLTFRRGGRLHLRWWLTAAPLFLAIATVTAVAAGRLHAGTGPVPAALLEVGAVLAAVGSSTVMAATVGAHRIPLALWHQDDDAPVEIVTWG